MALRRELARTHLTDEEETAARERAWLAGAEGWSDWAPWRRLAEMAADAFALLAAAALGFALYRWWGAGADLSAAWPLAGAGAALALTWLTSRRTSLPLRPLRGMPALACCLMLGVPLLAGGLWLVPLLALLAGAAALTALGRRSPLSAAVAAALSERLLGTPLLWAYAIAVLRSVWQGDAELLSVHFLGLLLGLGLVSLWDQRADLGLARSILQKTLRSSGA